VSLRSDILGINTLNYYHYDFLFLSFAIMYEISILFKSLYSIGIYNGIMRFRCKTSFIYIQWI